MGMQRFIVTYDISDDRDRRRVARLLSRRGVRLQRSVFEVRVPGGQLPRFLRLLERQLGPDDSVLVFSSPQEAVSLGVPVAGLVVARVSVH